MVATYASTAALGVPVAVAATAVAGRAVGAWVTVEAGGAVAVAAAGAVGLEVAIAALMPGLAAIAVLPEGRMSSCPAAIWSAPARRFNSTIAAVQSVTLIDGRREV